MVITLDQIIGLDNPVRQLDELVDYIIESGMIEIPTGKSFLGRRAYSAVDLMKLCLYGYLNQITTCRGLAEAARTNLELKWLINDQTPSYRTIADFRKNHSAFILRVETQFRAILNEDGLITNRTWVIDGSKIKASAARDMRSLTNLRKQVADINQSIEEYIGQSVTSEDKDAGNGKEDSGNGSGEGQPGSQSSPSKLDQLSKKRNTLQRLIEVAEDKGISYVSATDHDALLVKSRRGKLAGYNVQIVVDAENHMIAGYQFADKAVDNSSLYDVISSISFSTRTKPNVVLADKGYTNFIDIQRLIEELKVKVLVSLQEPAGASKGLIFKYDPRSNQIICPAGNIMKFRGKQFTRNQNYYTYQCKDCGSCEMREHCTKAKSGRTRRLSDNQKFKEQYRVFMEMDMAQRLVAKRKTVVEHVFGTISHLMGYNGFKLRGKPKVLTEFSLYALAYNFKRWLNTISPVKPAPSRKKRRLARLLFEFLFLLSSLWHSVRSFYVQFKAFIRDHRDFPRLNPICEARLLV